VVRKKYAAFEGALRGVDSRILVAQVPGGMLTNMESQLKEQGAGDKFDEVLLEIPRVREDLGFIALVTPTSQIVGTQAVLNILTGERYKTISKETAGVLKGEYGATPVPVNPQLQQRVLDGGKAITCRPADNISDELDKLTEELTLRASEKGITLAENKIEDVLTYALFPQIGLKFLENRGNSDAFEPVPTGVPVVQKPEPQSVPADDKGVYTVSVNGQSYVVEVQTGGDVSNIAPITSAPANTAPPASQGEVISAPLAGNIFKVNVNVGEHVQQGDVILILEAMKMETEIRAPQAGTITMISISEGDSVAVGDALYGLA
jgi:oxaloacetate decarboxylase alpha subunit